MSTFISSAESTSQQTFFSDEDDEAEEDAHDELTGIEATPDEDEALPLQSLDAQLSLGVNRDVFCCFCWACINCALYKLHLRSCSAPDVA